MSEVTISYQTLHLPPPFAHAYTLQLRFEKSALHVNYQLEHLNRDAITEEEILDEGYTENDDFEWEGELDAVWSDYIQKELDQVELTKPHDKDPFWIHIQSGKKEGHPKSLEKWDFLLQELIQAIYEQSKHELPLKANCVLVDKESTTQYDFEAKFAQRKASINSREVDWDQFQEIIGMVFSLEPGTGPKKQPKQAGLWIDMTGESQFYRLGDLSEKPIQSIISQIKGF